MQSRQSRTQSHHKRFTAMVAAGAFVGQLAACVAPPDAATEVAFVPEGSPSSSPSSPPSLSERQLGLTGTDRQIAGMLNISQKLGGDASCTPAPRGGMSGGINGLTATYTSRPDLDVHEASPEVIWINGHISGQGVIQCGYTRTMPDPADAYHGWRRSAMGTPPFELMMPCAVAEPFMPTEELPWEMLAAYVAGGEMVECTGSPPPIEDPPPGGGEDPPPGGEDPPPGGEDPPLDPPGGPIGGDAVAMSLPHLSVAALPERRAGAGPSIAATTEAAIQRLLADAPELADEVAVLRASMPLTFRAIHDSGKYAHLEPLARARAELTEARELLLPGVTPPPASSLALGAPRSSDDLTIQTGGTHCIPCAAYALIAIGELIVVADYVGKVATAATPAAKAAAWRGLISVFVITMGTSIMVLYYCTSCPPVMAALAYIGALLLDLTALTLYSIFCILGAIIGPRVC
jgi:hypothetical protein